MASPKTKQRQTRTIVVRNETYGRLEKFKVKLIAERGALDVTFDDVVNSLLDVAQR